MGCPLSPDAAQTSVFMATSMNSQQGSESPGLDRDAWEVLVRGFQAVFTCSPPPEPSPQPSKRLIGKCWPGLGGGIQNARLFKPRAAGDGGSINRRASLRLCSQTTLHSTQGSTWIQGEFPVYDVHWLGPRSPGPDIHRCQRAGMEDLQGTH